MTNKKVRVIVVDDDETIRQTLPRVLQVINYDVVGTASNGLEAINLYKATNPDMVLLDVNMPIKTGDQVLESLNEYINKSCFIMISFISEIDTVKKCVDKGAFYYIKKDLPLPQMMDVIEKTWEKYSKIHRSQDALDVSLQANNQNYIYNKIREDKFAYMLIERNMIDKQKFQSILTEKNGDVFEVMLDLIKNKIVDKKEVGWLWAASVNTSFVSLYGNKTDQELIRRLPVHVAKKFGIFPLYKVGSIVTVAFSRSLSMQDKHEISKIYGDNIDYVFSFPDEINTALSLNYQGQFSV